MTQLTNHEIARATEVVTAVETAFASKVVGQRTLLRSLLVTLMARGHVLMESVPGLAKTLSASVLASSVAASFSRVQCTPDLLPSDIVGTQVYDPRSATFSTQLGPVHAHFVLLDEINRSSAKTQSAMLEAMQERQTTIGGETHRLPDPFLVLATQNPIDEEGTYVLPQAQMDRFLLKEVLRHPSPFEEAEMLRRVADGSLRGTSVDAVATLDDVMFLQSVADRVHVDESVLRYIVEIVNVTRYPDAHLPADVARYVEHGASPRGAIAFLQAARGLAVLAGRDHVLPDDVVELRHQVLRHRILLTFEAMAARVSPDDVVDAVFAAVPTP
ncbi:AAA family ATPase [Nocardioides jishulii]|uniref:MoxR family ATPase n=1 Tax=Nocardioides jishulii TaxID=2575440 RepID=A0A4U2YJ46_9ACTN|nr:MoxR family ATPase [Nocardioides jishulii]QCX28236.1 MoxR family ATPase [Nocardioides jishulii]TKI60900.1 MoxR family ATPase [Nocardioides jishulii]